MRSEHAETFNHDPWAAGYDADVADESNPIRAGYAATLDWVAAQSAVGPDDVVVDLGAGTGNLAARLGAARLRAARLRLLVSGLLVSGLLTSRRHDRV